MIEGSAPITHLDHRPRTGVPSEAPSPGQPGSHWPGKPALPRYDQGKSKLLDYNPLEDLPSLHHPRHSCFNPPRGRLQEICSTARAPLAGAGPGKAFSVSASVSSPGFGEGQGTDAEDARLQGSLHALP